MTDIPHSYQAETSWFHLFRSMIDSGDAKAMGAGAFLVYCVIKAHTDFSTGRAFPSVATIMEKSGQSKRSVLRALGGLTDLGYLTVEKMGRHNVYRLREKVVLNDDHGRPSAVATWDYLPRGIKAAQAELKNFLLEGKTEGLHLVQIETLHLNVQINQGGENHQVNFGVNDLKSPEVREWVKRFDLLRKKVSGEHPDE